jgi:hypothetical protein
MPTTLRDVRFQGHSGKHLLLASISPFDPSRKSTTLAQPPPNVLSCPATEITNLGAFLDGRTGGTATGSGAGG